MQSIIIQINSPLLMMIMMNYDDNDGIDNNHNKDYDNNI